MKRFSLLLSFLFLIRMIMFSSGCIDSAPFTISDCSSGGNTLEVCFSVGGAMDVPGSTTVFWDFGDGNTGGGFNPCHTYAAAGTYTVYRRIDVSCSSIFSSCYLHMFSMSNSCDYTQTITVYANDFTSALDEQVICPDNIGEATFTPSTTLGVNWLWDPANSDIYYSGTGDPALDGTYKPITSSATNLTQTFTTSGQHVIYYTYGSGCQGLDTVNFDLVVEDSLRITADYNGENVSCFESSDGQVTSYAHGGTQPLTYTWDNGYVETNSTGFSINDNITAGQYIVQITDANGCLVEDTITLTEPPELVTTTTVTPLICSPLTTIEGQMEITSISGGLPAYTTLWSTGSSNLALTNLSNGFYSYIITDINGCQLFDTLEMHNTSKPVAAFTTQDVCVYTEAIFTDQSTNIIGTIVNWNWNFDDGNTSTTHDPTHLYNSDGNYNVELIIENDDNCKDTIVNPIVIFPKPVASFSAPNVCEYDDVIFTDLSVINNPDNINQWLWDFNDGSAQIMTQNTTHLYTNDGIYYPVLVVGSNNNCYDTLTQMLEIYPQPTSQFLAPDVCENTPPMNFTSISNVTPGNIVAWDWDFGDGQTGSGLFTNNNYAVNGVYNVQLITTTNHNCVDTVVQPVTVLAKPNVDFIADKIDGCTPVCVTFTDLSIPNSASITNWIWDFGNTDVATGSNIVNTCYENPSNTTDLTFDVGLIVMNDLGCYDTTTKINYISSYHYPIADFELTPEETNIYLSEIEFFNNSIGEDSDYWSYGDGFEEAVFEQPHTYLDSGTYDITLFVNTINNCPDTTVHPVRINAVTNIHVPNTFTPNGDNINDVFQPVVFNVVESNLMIFDRWGLLLFESDIVGASWDGNYKGLPSQQDTYVWKISVKDTYNKVHKYTGHVNLLR